MTAPHIRVDSVRSIIPDLYHVTRSSGEWFPVRGLEALGRAMRKEAQRHARTSSEPFLVRDSNGNVATLDAARGIFTYSSPCRAVQIDR